MALSFETYIRIRLAVVVFAGLAIVALLHARTVPSTRILTQDDVQIEAQNVLVDQNDASITLTRNCGCKAKDIAYLTNLSNTRTSRLIQILGTDGAVRAEWKLPLLPNDPQVVRMPNKETGALRISK